MVLKRPYAFLIKYFRIIHLIMFFMLLFIINKARDILNFFKDYISFNGNMEVISSRYISYFVYACLIVVIFLSIIIYYLMRYKKKPRVFYISTIVVSVVSFILFIYLFSGIRKLELLAFSGREIRLFRDFARINFWLLFVNSIPMIIRGLGFDIKKFNFTSDLKELNLSSEDNAEVEVNTNIDSNSVKRLGRRTIRELKYYYMDNKLIINIIFGVIGLIIVLFSFNRTSANRSLNEGEILSTTYFNFRVNKAYISDRKRISSNNSYVILDISVIGKTSKYSLELNRFVLEGKNNMYTPSQKFYYYFTDVGIGYRNYELDTKEYKNYILMYNIDNIDRNNKFILNYLTDNRKIRLKLEELA